MGKVDFELGSKLAAGRARAGELGRELTELETAIRGLMAELASATAAATEETELALIENRKPEASILRAVEPIEANLKATKAKLETMKGAAARQRGIVDDLQTREAGQRQQAALQSAVPVLAEIRRLLAEVRNKVVIFNAACAAELSVGDFMQVNPADGGISYDLAIIREIDQQIAMLAHGCTNWREVLHIGKEAV